MFCETQKVPEPVNEEFRVTNLLQSYKPDRTLHFDDGKFQSRFTTANTCPQEEPQSLTQMTFKEENIKNGNLENKSEKERNRNLLRSSLRPSYTIDLEKKERIMV